MGVYQIRSRGYRVSLYVMTAFDVCCFLLFLFVVLDAFILSS